MESKYYRTEIHKYSTENQYLVLDVLTSRVFSIDKITYDILAFSDQKTANEITEEFEPEYSKNEVIEVLDELKKVNLLSNTKYEYKIPDSIENYKPYEIRTIDAILSQDCNMRCIYCFADKGAFHGKRGLMSTEVGKKSIDFLLKESGESTNINIVFFGGEPLINMPVLKDMVEYGNKKAKEYNKKISYSTSTNGTLLKGDVLEYLIDHNVNIQVSIDGDLDSQNYNRPFKNRKGSYNMVEKNIKNLLPYMQKKGIQARTTISDQTSSDTFHDVLHLLSLGFRDVHTEPAEGTLGNGFLSEEDYNKLIAEIDKIAEEMSQKISENKYVGYHNIIKYLSAINCNGSRVYSCGAGRGYVAVGIDGNIYPCHRFVGNDNYHMGNVLDDSFNRKWEKEIHDSTNIFKREVCSDCWVRFFCGGDCIAVSDCYYENLTTPSLNRCRLIKHTVELAMKIYSTIPRNSKSDIETTYRLLTRKKKEVRAEA